MVLLLNRIMSTEVEATTCNQCNTGRQSMLYCIGVNASCLAAGSNGSRFVQLCVLNNRDQQAEPQVQQAPLSQLQSTCHAYKSRCNAWTTNILAGCALLVSEGDVHMCAICSYIGKCQLICMVASGVLGW